MASSAERPERRVVAARATLPKRLRDIWRYRELLVGLIRKELKVKYKNSVLGFVWSMLNPALYLVVFYVVFTYVLPNGDPVLRHLPAVGAAGVEPLLIGAAGRARDASSATSALVKKVAFPREILVLATVGAVARALLPAERRAPGRTARVPASRHRRSTCRCSFLSP